MTGVKASLASQSLRKAQSAALFALALLALCLAPAPAVFTSISAKATGAAPAAISAVLQRLVEATPVFALPAFALGCAIGALVYLVSTSPSHIGDAEFRRWRLVGRLPVVASGLFVGATFASMGLVFATFV